MLVNDFDYDLPNELIAQYPRDKREDSRLMVIDRKTDTISHRYFYEILDFVNPCDCLVLNNSKVLPARLFGIKEKTGQVNRAVWFPGYLTDIQFLIQWTKYSYLSFYLFEQVIGLPFT
jgi:S-adenosylmethionine:tRNA-ribosyltransferase-isomerase (queuine synthetase)